MEMSEVREKLYVEDSHIALNLEENEYSPLAFSQIIAIQNYHLSNKKSPKRKESQKKKENHTPSKNKLIGRSLTPTKVLKPKDANSSKKNQQGIFTTPKKREKVGEARKKSNDINGSKSPIKKKISKQELERTLSKQVFKRSKQNNLQEEIQNVKENIENKLNKIAKAKLKMERSETKKAPFRTGSVTPKKISLNPYAFSVEKLKPSNQDSSLRIGDGIPNLSSSAKFPKMRKHSSTFKVDMLPPRPTKASISPNNITIRPVTANSDLKRTTREFQRTFENKVRKNREMNDDYMIFNLFNHIVASLGNERMKISAYFGKGNNHEFLWSLLESRGSVEPSSVPGTSQLVWCQNRNPDSRPTSINSAKRYYIKFLNCPNFFTNPYNSSTEGLIEMLQNARIFKFDPETARSSFESVVKSQKVCSVISDKIYLVNNIKGMHHIARKSLLAQTIIDHGRAIGFDPFTIIPQTYFIKGARFEKDIDELVKIITSSPDGFEVPYIVKPGEFTNRGKGITMAYSEKDLREQCSSLFTKNKKSMHAIVQIYLRQPLLYKGRKFDVRCYALVLKTFSKADVFWYSNGYIRTSSYEYDQNAKDNLMVHLTNEAVQVKNKESFGKFEPGNKIYYPEIEEYFRDHPAFVNKNKRFIRDLVKEMRVGFSYSIDEGFAMFRGVHREDLHRVNGYWV